MHTRRKKRREKTAPHSDALPDPFSRTMHDLVEKEFEAHESDMDTYLRAVADNEGYEKKCGITRSTLLG